MTNLELIINHTSYQLADLPRLSERASLPLYEQQILQFCEDWLSGQQVFTVHTSGSTGKPKPITLTRTQMIMSARATGKALNLNPGDRAFVCLFTEYIAGMMMLVRGLELGLHLTIVDPSSRPLADFPSEANFDFVAMVPLQLQATLNGTASEQSILNRMKAILIGGAPVSVALQEQLQAVSAPIYHTYGMTETVTHIALKRLNGLDQRDVFVPFADVVLGVDDRGCLNICAPVTQNRMVQTNDLVTLLSDGSFVWHGRADNIINSGGVKVQLEKVETALEKAFLAFQSGVHAQRRFFVGAMDDDRLGQKVVLVIEGDPFLDGAEDRLKLTLAKYLKKHEIPRQIYFVPHLLETPTGKIDRSKNIVSLTQDAVPS
ncbi:MAG: AMP-binding protein [Chloroflexota bacterium]